MGLLPIIILGIIQGITEFLPVSSSGHLVIAQALFHRYGEQTLPDDVVELNILLHAGTLLAILVFFWRRILLILTTDRRMIGRIVVGTLPAVAIGLPLKKYGDAILQDPLLTGFMLVATGLLLIWSGRRPQGDLDFQEITYTQALLIGLFQAVAILPGLSRSGWTIAGGLMLGLRRDTAATFSFMLAIPAILGACVLQLGDLVQGEGSGTPLGPLAVGVVVSFVVGLVSLWALIHIVRQGKLQWFAAWCIPAGIAVILWQLTS